MNKSYDYIIIGAGSAGCVLANRLSADGHEVLLLEAGGWDWSPLIKIPLGTGKLLRSKLHGWGYSTEPEPNCNNRELFWPRGRVLGGSSSINSMIYIRGNRLDYNQWSQLGCSGWSYEHVLPYFRRSEKHEFRNADEYHGTEGNLYVSAGRVQNRVYDTFVAATAAAGHRITPDFNGANQEGAGRFEFTIRDGRRCSSAVAYLHPVSTREQLHIVTRAMTSRVRIESGRAVGVDYVKEGVQVRANAEREVIVSGGSLNSPQVLMLSGIGPADHLREMGVDVAHDLPGVGKNLQDHLDVPVRHTCPEPITLHSEIRFDRVAWSMLRAGLTGQGFAAAFPSQSGAFLRTRAELEAPDIQLHMLGGLGAGRIRWPWQALTGQGRLEQDGFTIRVCQLRPESRGRVRLRSTDPQDRVRIYANYLATENDIRTLRDGVRITREIFAQAPFDDLRGEELDPGASRQSDAELDAWIRQTGETIYHPVGTCKMGTDDRAVVDPQLKVRGIAGLRVVDASVMPTLTGGNTNAPTIMIAEKAADMILGKAALEPSSIASSID